jgi:tripartite ATP-independent transporter DctM subunit
MSIQVSAVIMLFGSLASLMFIKLPIAFSLGIATTITALYLNMNLYTIFQRMVMQLYNFGFLAVPFFILAANIMVAGGISDKLMSFADVFVGRIRGGKAIMNVLVSMLFGGISGSSVADVSSIGSLLIPAMKKEGYDTDYSVAVTVTSSVQGVIIPPSQNIIYYAIAAGGLSIGELFIAGYIPGVLLGVSLMTVTYFIALKRRYPVGRKYSWRESLRIAIDSILGLTTIIIIIGGIVGGVFTPTESAGIAAVYALLITTFVYQTMTFKKVIKVFEESLSSLASIMAVVAMSGMFAYLLTVLRVPIIIYETILNITDNPILIMLMINIFLLFAGMFMDMAVLIFMLTPIFFPMIVMLGYSPIHFGIILVLNLGIGLTTPPVGNSLIVGCAIGKLPIENSVKAFLPFWLVMILTLIIIIVFPQICLWLPSQIW